MRQGREGVTFGKRTSTLVMANVEGVRTPGDSPPDLPKATSIPETPRHHGALPAWIPIRFSLTATATASFTTLQACKHYAPKIPSSAFANSAARPGATILAFRSRHEHARTFMSDPVIIFRTILLIQRQAIQLARIDSAWSSVCIPSCERLSYKVVHRDTWRGLSQPSLE